MCSSILKIEPLGRENYDTWKMHIEALLTKNDTFGYVTGDIVKPTEEVRAKEWELADGKAKADIILAISSGELKQVKGCKSSKDVWDKLSSIYESKGPARKASLLKNLVLKRMKTGDSVRDHLNDFFDVVDKLENMDIVINEDLLTIMLLYSLPHDFENFRIAIETRDTLPSPQALKIKIVEESEARKENKENYTDTDEHNAFLGKSQPRQQYREKLIDLTDARKPQFRSNRPCFNCSKSGHISRFCPERRTRHQEESAVVCENNGDFGDNGDVGLLIHESSNFQSTDIRWCLDSGCTSHMTNELSILADRRPDRGRSVSLANDTHASSKGIGTAIIPINDGHNKLSLSETLFVPELRTNLISVGKITDKGYRVIFDKDTAIVQDGEGLTKLTADRNNGLYYLRQHQKKESVQRVSEQFSLLAWHRKFGHLNFKDLRRLIRERLARGIRANPNEIVHQCETCIQAKLTRRSYPQSEGGRSSGLLEVVHTDLCGPMRIQSFGKSRYFITFIDDFSRWTEVRFLKNKNEALNAFKNYKNMVENMTGRKIKFLQSDNGREYDNHEFNTFLDKCGIQRRFTCARTPQQNGVAERQNRTLNDMARSFLIESSLPQMFWAEAISTAAHIRNRCPSDALNGELPYTYWTGKTPVVAYFQQFGSKVYVLNKDPSRGKYDPRGKAGVFVGYPNSSKGYRVWLPDEKKFVTSSDVRFMSKTEDTAKVISALKEIGYTNDDLSISKYLITISGNETSRNPLSTVQPTVSTVQDDPAPCGTNQQGQEFHEQIESQDHQQIHCNPGDNNDFPLRRSGRTTKGIPPERYRALIADSDKDTIFEPRSWKQVESMQGPEKEKWILAAREEMESLIQNQTWALVELPPGKKAVGSKWVFKVKYGNDGKVERYKARLVAKGFLQKYGEDYDEVFAPTINPVTVRILLTLAASKKLFLRQFDVKTAFLNGDLKEDIYMTQPEGFENQNSKNLVCKLQKSLYGLKQAARAWNEKINGVLIDNGFRRSDADSCLYVKLEEGSYTYIVIHVDDILCAGSEEGVQKAFQLLSLSFELKDLGTASNYLGVEIEHDGLDYFIHQRRKIEDLVTQFGLQDAKPVKIPMEAGFMNSNAESTLLSDNRKYRQAIGSLLYLAVTSRPDISSAVGILSRRVEKPTQSDWNAVKRVVSYLKSTLDIKLRLSSQDEIKLNCYVDADWAGDREDRKSISGCLFRVGSSCVGWLCKKQTSVALSSTEAELVAASTGVQEAVWIRMLLKDMGHPQETATSIFEDNQSCMKFIENDKASARIKHLDVRKFYMKDLIHKREISLEYCPTDDNLADILTKPIAGKKFQEFRARFGFIG